MGRRIWFLIELFHFCLIAGETLKVFDFYGDGISKYGNESLDYFQLDNDVGREYPSKFTLCLSHYQEKFTANKMLQIYDRNENPWFYLYVYAFSKDKVTFWIELEGEFLNFGEIKGKKWTSGYSWIV